MATLTFHGAIEGVTGSAYLLETANARVLFDCGLFQGRRREEEANYGKFPYDPRTLDGVVISHAHLDHSGRIPKLFREGYEGPLHMTRPTCELIGIMLKDSAHLIERETEWENRFRRRQHKKLLAPVYTLKDVEESMRYCMGVPYGDMVEVAEGVKVRFRDAGHILGSAIVEVFVTEDGREKKLVFTGDLGNSCSALLRDPEIVTEADILLCESTYGNRNHRSLQETLKEFTEIVGAESGNQGNVLIPSFAVGRTQEIIFRLGQLYQQGNLGYSAVYLDSPMAIDVTAVYNRYQHVYNKEDLATIRTNGKHDLNSFLPVLRLTSTTEQSMSLNNIKSGAIIIAGSGMCNGGRIRHHLRYNLGKRNAHVIMVGYQAMGTPGRLLVDGKKIIRLGREKIVVKASIHTIGGFSAHAGQSQLLDWINHFGKPRPKLFLVHGEATIKETFRDFLAQHGWQANIPGPGQRITF